MKPIIGLMVLYHMEAGATTGWLDRVCPALVQGWGMEDTNKILLAVFTPIGLSMLEASVNPGEGIGSWKPANAYILTTDQIVRLGG